MGNESREKVEVDLQKLVFTYLRKWWLILLCVILGGTSAYWYTHNFVTPQYRASVTVYVNSFKAGEQVTYISSSNLATAQRLVSTYVNIIESDTVLNKVAEVSGLNNSAAQIRSVMSTSQVGDTELFRVHITHPNPDMAAKIANAIAEVAPGEIESFVEGSSTKIIDYAKVPKNPSSPNLKKNCTYGGLLGCAFALVYLTLRVLLDVKIREEMQLTMMFDIPVLGQVPAFIMEGGKRRNTPSSTYDTATERKGGGK